MGELPPKLFFRIGEVAEFVGVEPHVLRYWEREFRSIRPTKSAKGQRIYSRRDVENLLRVRDLLYRDGFTIAGAKKKLSSPETASVSSAPEPRAESAETSIADDDGAPPTERHGNHNVRARLVALRGEVEAFLDELSTSRSSGR
jgi:DNA-binding transcriptional MerR regulator